MSSLGTIPPPTARRTKSKHTNLTVETLSNIGASKMQFGAIFTYIKQSSENNMEDPYEGIREELEEIEELFTILEEYVVVARWSQKLFDAIGRKIKLLISKIEGFSGKTSEKATMEFIRKFRALMQSVKGWDEWFKDLDTALNLMYDLLAPEEEMEPARKRLRFGSA